MKTLALLLLFPQILTAQTIRNFEEIPGCPINTYCTEEQGLALLEWEKRLAQIEKNKYKNSSQKTFPLLILKTKDKNFVQWKSGCRIHNPKNPNKRIYKTLGLFQKTIDDQGFDPIKVYHSDKAYTYYVPYQAKPLFIKNEKLVFLQEYNDIFYYIMIGKNGDIKVQNQPLTLIKKAQRLAIENVKCPDKLSIDESKHSQTYCEKILDLDTNKLKLIQYPFSCP